MLGIAAANETSQADSRETAKLGSGGLFEPGTNAEGRAAALFGPIIYREILLQVPAARYRREQNVVSILIDITYAF